MLANAGMPAQQHLRVHITKPELSKIPAQGWNDGLLEATSLRPDNPSCWRTMECQPSSILECTYPAPNHLRFQLKAGMTNRWMERQHLHCFNHEDKKSQSKA
ncbi:hypothetical protein BCT07_07675 [Vibrio breoganii]|nr:hypothetical protein BCT07_07675 [Vibrio breoganii]